MQILKLSKRGMTAHTGNIIEILIGVLVVLVILVALAPQYFSGLGTGATGLGNTTVNPDVPTWLPTTLIIIVAAGLLFMVWRMFSYKAR